MEIKILAWSSSTFSKILRLESWVIFRFHFSCGNVSHFKSILRQTTSIPQHTKSILQNTKSTWRHTTNTLQQKKACYNIKVVSHDIKKVSRDKQEISSDRPTPNMCLSPKQVSRTFIISNLISEKVSQTVLEVSQTQKRYLRLQANISNSKEVSRTLSEVFLSRLARFKILFGTSSQTYSAIITTIWRTMQA